MKHGNPAQLDEILKRVSLDDRHAYIYIEYDQNVVSLDCLIKTIETAGEKVLEITDFRKEPEGNKIIVIKLGTQDVRNAILNLSSHPLIRVEGCNSKASLDEKQSQKRQ